MPALSATTIQKAYKTEVTSVFGEASYSTGTGQYTLVSANGRSKGIASITRDPATKHVTIKLDSSIPVKNWLGAQNVQVELATPAGSTTSVASIIVEKVVGTGASVKFELVDKNDNATDPGNGDKILVTLTFTTSQVF